MRRRTFLKAGLASAAAVAVGLPAAADSPVKPPNILWISAEDISPDLGCYGDAYASTPTIDAFAEGAIRYERAYSHSGVCAPSRSGIITGMYPTSIGTQHMRCSGIPPAEAKCFPEYLRAAGYFTSNHTKTDYQFDSPLSAWDQNGKDAHWRNRAEGQPFFSVFNLTVCHESQVRNHSPEFRKRIDGLGDRKHDPAQAPVPPYHADTAATRADWAQYYDIISLMDDEAKEILAQLEADGLAEDTIVWFWGDHGRGLTRCKRWLYESGTRVPLLVRVPEKYRAWVRPGAPESLGPGANDEMVCFIDFAPTMLSLAGVPIPDHMQGQAFLGRAEAPPRQYIYGARDRMDEAYDLIRTVRDKQYRYFRNYMPYVTYAQHIQYMDEMPMLQDLRRLHAEGKLRPEQERWFAPAKPLEELYDVEADPHELNDLADDPQFLAVLTRMREAHQQWMEDTADLGLIPEPLLDQAKWPDGNVPQCAAVQLALSDSRIAASCTTPGASINFRWDDDPPKRWRLYSDPVAVREGRQLTAMANRPGFKDSGESRPGSGAEAAPGSTPAPTMGSAELLTGLRALRAHDFEGAGSAEIYLAAINHDEPALRYWGIIGLHRMGAPAPPARGLVDTTRGRLTDPSNVVRVAAAHALCDWGEPGAGLPVLQAVLGAGMQSERLYAARALLQLAEAARPARSSLEEALHDSWPYVVWTVKLALTRIP